MNDTATTTRISRFQFTPLREGRPADQSATNAATSEFQFTPLREGRLNAFRRFWSSF